MPCSNSFESFVPEFYLPWCCRQQRDPDAVHVDGWPCGHKLGFSALPQYESPLQSVLFLHAGSDAILTRCLWTIGLAVTDPGFSALPPGVDPATFPDSPLHIDDPCEIPPSIETTFSGTI